MSFESAPALQPGYLLAGKYRILRTLGVGGMGVVLAAHHELLGHPVAVKLLLGVKQEPDAAQRLLNEARAAAGIHSEHVVRVYDVSRLDDGTPFLVLEYLEGRDLNAELEARGPLSHVEVAEYLVQAMQALAQAHAIGIVHRDLKPSNLFLAHRPDGIIVKVLDFGIAKDLSLAAQQNVALTRSRATLGSPLYMSPEQVRDSRAVDARSDLWSLGAIVYELVSGEPPFDAETVGGVFAAILEKKILPLYTRVPGVPRAFSDAVMRCLERDPKQRWSSVSELATALAPFAPKNGALSVERIQRLGQSSPHLPLELRATVDASGDNATVNATANANWAGNVATTSNRRTAVVAVAAVVGGLAVASCGLVLYRALAVRGHEPSISALSAAAPSASSPGAAPIVDAAATTTTVVATAAPPSAPASSVAAAPVASAPPPKVGAATTTTPPATLHRPPGTPPSSITHDRSSF